MMEVVTGQKKLTGYNVEYPLPWVEPKDANMCEGESFAGGCNPSQLTRCRPCSSTPRSKAIFCRSSAFKAVQEGKPTPGATIQKLPEVHYADNLPGINCSACKAPKDWLEPNRVKSIPVP